MNILQPTRTQFWRFIIFVISALLFLTAWQSYLLALSLGVDVWTRPSWTGFLAGMLALGFLALLVLTLTWSRFKERIFALLESPEHISGRTSHMGWGLIAISLVGFTVFLAIPFIRSLLGREGWFRFLVFWFFSLVGFAGARMLWRNAERFTSFISVMTALTAVHMTLVNLSIPTDYPFALGWSETSRFYHPSMFVSPFVYGQRYPFPIINPGLHLLLVPPHLLGFSLWGHRFWQVALRLVLIAVTAVVFARRLSSNDRNARWLLAIYLLLYLFFGPIYYHLTLAVILVLAGYSSEHPKRTWLVILIASAWSGWSRVNWFPVPAMLAAVIYVLETPYQGKKLFYYLLKPALWGFAGLATAFLFQRIYIVMSGVENTAYFYTTLVSDLLWYRLWPSATSPIGILPSILRFSVPFWFVIFLVLYKRKGAIHPLRIFLSLAAMTVLLVVGIIVTVKIGGGSDLHNMDSYFVMMLLILGYLVCARYRREDGSFDEPFPIHWILVLVLLVMPIQNQLKFGLRFTTYDVDRTHEVMNVLQNEVDRVNTQGGEILFITQRQLIAMDMLKNVTLVPEYEREDLMEMAMGHNQDYLGRFRADMDAQRFDLIVVDPLNYTILSRKRSFNEENNVWVLEIMRPILCNYQMEVEYPADDIALFIPQTGDRQCP